MSAQHDEAQAFDVALRALRQEQGSAEQAHALEQRLLQRLGPQALSAPVTTASISLGRAWTLFAVCGLLGMGVLFGRGEQAPRANEPAALHVERAHVPATSVSPSLLGAPVSPALHPLPAPIEGTRKAPHVPRRRVQQPATPVEASDVALATAAAPSGSLEEELALLERARAALRRDSALALTLAEQHAHDYPSGRFVQEREVLAIQALLKQARDFEAIERTQRFIREQPGSSYVLGLRHMLASKPGSAGPLGGDALGPSTP